MVTYTQQNCQCADPDEALLETEIERARLPFERSGTPLSELRERLLTLMWDDVGVLRDETSLRRALSGLQQIEDELLASGVGAENRVFNLTWHDWLNLRSLVEVSQVIASAALAREDSRGAHFREDFPETGDLESSGYTVVRQSGETLETRQDQVEFSIVRPGESLLKDDAA